MSWPRRTRICLECRAALSDEELCTWVRHTPISPSDPEQRGRLMDAVWPAGPPRPPVFKNLGPLLDQLIDRCREWYKVWIKEEGSPPPIAFPPSPTLRSGSRAARGADEEPLWTARTRHAGRVVGDAPTAPSPISATPCVAYGLWLLRPDADRSAVLLRDGATIGFDVDLDDGRLARVPPGSTDVVADGVRLSRRRHRQALSEYLVHLGPAPDRARSHLPFTEVREAVVRPGDKVRLLADLEVIPDRRSVTGSAYREAAVAVLSPVGRVVIEPRE